MNMYNLYESTEETLRGIQQIPRYNNTVYDNGWKYTFKFAHEKSDNGLMEIVIDMIVDLQDNLVMGTNLFCGAMSQVLQYMKEKVPTLSSEDLGSHVTIRLNSMDIEYGLGIMDIFDFIDRPIVNELRVPRELSQLLKDGTDEYCLATPDQLPHFEENYMEEVTRMTKKAKVIYKALKKGTLDGEPYVIPDNPLIRVRQMRSRYDFDSKIIRPDLFITIIPLGKYETTLDPTRLSEYLKERFNSFGIEYKYVN